MSEYDQKLYRNVGVVIELLARSKYHAEFELRSYIEVEIAPAFLSQQVRIFSVDERPIGFVSWARITKALLDELASTGRSLRPDEWACGSVVLINDIVADTKHLNHVVNTLRREVFWADSVVFAFRRTRDGSVRKICKFRNFAEGRAN